MLVIWHLTDREVFVVPGGAEKLHTRWDGTRCSWIGYLWGGGVRVKFDEADGSERKEGFGRMSTSSWKDRGWKLGAEWMSTSS